MLSILYTALVMFVSGIALCGGMLLIEAVSKAVVIAIAKHKFKKTMKGDIE